MWGSGSFPEGVYNKVVPGTYINIKVTNNAFTTNTERGYLACPIELPWGKDDEIITITSEDYVTNCFSIFGYNLGAPELTFVDEMFKNASTLHLYRLNSGGEKAKGTFGEALYSGEYGNKITVVVEEDPDNPGETEPPVQKTPKAEIQQVTENEEYNVVFTDCEEDNKIKVEVKKDLEDISGQADKVTIGQSGSTRNVKFLEAAEAGSYTITAYYDSQQLAQQPVTIAEKVVPVTVEIQQVEENKEYNVVYSGTVEENKISIEVTKDGADITSESEKVTIGESGTTRNVKLTEQAESGTYKIIAKYDSEEKKSQEFTYTQPEVEKPVTVEINEVEANKEYNVVYSGESVEENKIKIEVTKDSEDITSSSDVVTIGESGTTRNVKLTETAESGTYKIIAKYDSEEKKSQEFTYTKI